MNEYKTLQDIVYQLEMSEYQCVGGYLKNNTAFIRLKELANRVSVPLDLLVSLDDSQPVLLAEEFYKDNPKTRNEMNCMVDDDYGDPSCVWDTNEPEKCSVACKGIKKENCKYWVNKVRTNHYSSDDVFDWLKSKQSK